MPDEITQAAVRAAMSTVERLTAESTNDDGTVDLAAMQARLEDLVQQIRAAWPST
jgi:hypothetical protein